MFCCKKAREKERNECLSSYQREGIAETVPNKQPAITERQQEVLVLLAEGATDHEIARRLDISARTVQFHVDRIKERLEARSRPELITRAHEQGLLP